MNNPLFLSSKIRLKKSFIAQVYMEVLSIYYDFDLTQSS